MTHATGIDVLVVRILVEMAHFSSGIRQAHTPLPHGQAPDHSAATDGLDGQARKLLDSIRILRQTMIARRMVSSDVDRLLADVDHWCSTGLALLGAQSSVISDNDMIKWQAKASDLSARLRDIGEKAV